MASLPLFVATNTPWRPGLVIAKATPASGGATLSINPAWEAATEGGRAGVRVTALPGLALGVDYKVVLVVFPL